RMRDRAVDGRDFDVAAESGLAEGDRHLANEVQAVAAEQGVIADADQAVEIASRCSGLTGFAFAGETNARVRIDAGRNIHFESAMADYPAGAMTRWTRIGDDDAAAAAPATRLLNPKESLALDDRAVAIAAAARDRLRSLSATG